VQISFVKIQRQGKRPKVHAKQKDSRISLVQMILKENLYIAFKKNFGVKRNSNVLTVFDAGEFEFY